MAEIHGYSGEHRWRDGRMDAWMDRWKDGWMDRWKDAWRGKFSMWGGRKDGKGRQDCESMDP